MQKEFASIQSKTKSNDKRNYHYKIIISIFIISIFLVLLSFILIAVFPDWTSKEIIFEDKDVGHLRTIHIYTHNARFIKAMIAPIISLIGYYFLIVTEKKIFLANTIGIISAILYLIISSLWIIQHLIDYLSYDSYSFIYIISYVFLLIWIGMLFDRIRYIYDKTMNKEKANSRIL